MAGSDPIIRQGQMDFSGGVNSVCVPTIASDNNPNGLAPNQLAWLVNATVRDGGITQRAGWNLKGTISYIPQTNLLNQGGIFYEPIDKSTPYILVAISGHIWKISVDFSFAPVDLTENFNLVGALSTTEPQYFFCQAEQFVVIQDGSNANLPLFWDGANLTQSHGITGTLVVGQPIDRSFQITFAAPWLEAALGYTSLPVYLQVGTNLTAPYNSAPFNGNLGDNIQLTVLSSGDYVGDFRVVQVTPTSIALQSIALAGSPTTIPAGVVYVATLENPLANPNGPIPNPVGGTATVAIGTGSWTIPAKGGQVMITTLQPYFGEVGDTINVTSEGGLINYGTYTVISFDSTPNLRLQLSSVGDIPSGQIVIQSNLTISITAVRTYSDSWTTAGGFVVPADGGQVHITAQRFTPAYQGKVGDFVLMKVPSSGGTVGLFRYVASVLPTGEAGAGSVFEGVSIPAANVGVEIGSGTGIGIVCTVVGPGNNNFPISQNVTLGTGSWFIPPPGQQTGPATGQLPLQIYWNYPNTGVLNSYPGNVGDTITLINESPALTLGTFLVTAFDGAGGITLQTVSSAIQGTSEGTFNAPVIASITETGASPPATMPPSTTGLLINQLPAATEMIYYMGRIFYNKGNVFAGGDIVGNQSSGTSAYQFSDSVLSVTESPLAFGGDGFTLPTQAGPITGFAVPNTLDASLGQGILLVGTRQAIYAFYAPVTRSDWINASSNNPPQIVQVQFRDGFVGQGSVVGVNGDNYYLTWEPGIRSLLQATRLFSEPGNVPLSAEEYRILQFNDTSLENFSTGINFDNRLLMTALPMQTTYGVVHQAILPMDFTPISSASEKSPACWEGHQEGLQIFQLLEQDFNGVDRAFAITLTQNPALPGAIELWELTTDNQFENQGETSESRVTWQVEFPALEWNDITQLKKLVSAELWVDRIFGTVEFLAEWRPDGQTCWNTWAKWKVCSARNANESPGVPISYPTEYGEGYRQMMSLPKPPETCAKGSERPGNIGYQFQTRLTITGFCRIRGWWLDAEMQSRKLYQNMICSIKDFVSNLLKW